MLLLAFSLCFYAQLQHQKNLLFAIFYLMSLLDLRHLEFPLHLDLVSEDLKTVLALEFLLEVVTFLFQ